MRCVGFITAVGLLLTGCGVPNAFSSQSQTQPSPSSTGAAKPAVENVSVSTGINEKVQPKKESMPLLRVGAKGDNALLINEVLATLHYLPLQFTPDEHDDATGAFELKLASQLDYGASKTAGTWKWTASYPAALTSLWNSNTVSVLTEGAIMDFERDHGMVIDGVAGSKVDAALCDALRNNAANTHPYVNVTVSKTLPERLIVWSNGKEIYSTLANTGIPAAPTPDGTYPVYARYISNTMSGTNPDGTKYKDPGVPWVSYFYQGCAIHGFPRSSYGWPQSLGCVELPIDHAKIVYGLINYGTLVSVTG